MGVKDLLLLRKKENRTYLFLGILLILASVFAQFEVTNWRGTEIYFWVLNTCIVYYFFSFILRDKIVKYNYFIFPLSFLLSHPLIFFFTYSKIGFVINAILLIFGMFYWFTITALFAINKSFKRSTDLDLKIENFSKSLNYLVRGIIFIGGAVTSTLLLLVSSEFIIDYGIHTGNLRFYIWPLVFFMIIYIWFFFIIGCVALVFKKKYFWFGPLFILCSIYAIYIMIQAAKWSSSVVSPSVIPLLHWASYFGNVFLLLYTIADLVGKQKETLFKKIKFIRPETIIIGLIFSMGMVESMAAASPQDIIILQLNFLTDFYPILVGIFMIFAIFGFNKKMKKQKEQIQLAEVSISEKLNIIAEQKDILEEIINPIYCTKCDKANPREYKFCRYCGSALLTKEIEPFKREEVTPYKVEEVEPFKKEEVTPYKAEEIEPFKKEEVTPYKAEEVEPFKKEEVTPYKAEEVEPFKKEAGIITSEKVEIIPLFCTRCGKSNPTEYKFCRYCGSELFKKEEPSFKENLGIITSEKVETKPLFCTKCGKANPIEYKFCRYCGANLFKTNQIT